ncbi:hypothetical protein [Bosea sp. BK604]|uniref:hypothetical protein n=1 Tax=Bosea sp. BK604 TaxID=2512180 RepID=UPI00104E73CE|nr:hypothetical protein [Bosea sp. BK604]
MILRDGTAVPLAYCLAILKDRSRCHGTLFGDLSRIDPQEFADKFRYILEDGGELMLRVTTHSDVDLTFVGDIDQLADQSAIEKIASQDRAAGTVGPGHVAEPSTDNLIL